ncbi:MAG: alpha/beta hydrolase fold domain-containing protein [Sphingobium sp.]
MADGACPLLPPERPGHPAPPAVAAMRAGMARAVAAGQWRTDPPPVEEEIAGVRVLRFRPDRPARGRVIHFHGGGYRLGCPEIAGPYAAALAAASGVEVLCPSYRLAPEHPFPAGIRDGMTVFQELASKDGLPLILSGDSAGGGLAAALAVIWVGKPVSFCGLILLSPWLDLHVSAASYDGNAASDPLFSRAAATLAARLYLQDGTAPDHPLASPLFAPLDGWPPVLLSVGEGEVLLDDARAMHARLRAAGVDTRFAPVAGMDHVAVVRGLDLPGAAETFAGVTAFIDRILS